MPETAPPGEVPRGRLDVEVWLRDEVPPGVYDRQERTLARLDGVRTAGVVGDVTVRTWGRRMRLDAGATPADDRAHESVESFRQWAAERGHDLEPGFQVREVCSLVADEIHEVLTFPLVCVALYRDGAVRGVFPCSSEEGVHTVEDCLVDLETLAEAASEGEDADPTAADATRTGREVPLGVVPEE